MFALSKKVANKMFSSGYIEEESVPVYQYGLFWLFNIIEFLLISIITGLIFNVLISNIIFFISFMLLRGFGGGFHADTEMKCQLISLTTFTLSALALKYIISVEMLIPMLIAELFFSIFIIGFSPVQFSCQELSAEEKDVYRKLSCGICVCVIILSVICIVLRFDKIFSGLSISIVLQGVMIILGLVVNHIKSKNPNRINLKK